MSLQIVRLPNKLPLSKTLGIKMKLVIQQEKTGCAIASSAALAGISYKKEKSIANALGVYAEDSTLWSETNYIRKIKY